MSEEFEDRRQARQRWGATWFDCPYKGHDIISHLQRRDWFRGWDSVRKEKDDK